MAMGGGHRGAFGSISLLLIAGSIVLIFFVILSGVTNTTPLNKTWFLQVDTSSIASSGRAISQWTYFYVCGANNTDCGKPVPDLPIGYAWVGGNAGVPPSLVGSHGKGTTSTYYYYMWRFGWVFYLLGLFFNLCAFLTALLAPCSRLASGFSGIILMGSLFFFTLASTLMTAVFVRARDQFLNAGISAHIGRYAFGFTWGAWTCMLLATILLFMGCGAGSRNRDDDQVRSARTGGNMVFFRRQREKRARGSFVDNESQRRVKDEYA